MNGLTLNIICGGNKGFSLELDCKVSAIGITAIYGPSGSGKSTLLDCIAGLRQAEPGSVIRLNNEHGRTQATPRQSGNVISAMCFRTPGCSRISMCSRTLTMR